MSICLPNEGHFEPTLKVIRAGFPLLVEKPLVFDLEEADILLREAEARSLFFAININHRYATPVAMAAEAIRGGDLGEPVLATWRFGGEPGASSHPTPTSSRPSATASTCSSTCAGRSTR